MRPDTELPSTSPETTKWLPVNRSPSLSHSHQIDVFRMWLDANAEVRILVTSGSVGEHGGRNDDPPLCSGTGRLGARHAGLGTGRGGSRRVIRVHPARPRRRTPRCAVRSTPRRRDRRGRRRPLTEILEASRADDVDTLAFCPSSVLCEEGDLGGAVLRAAPRCLLVARPGMRRVQKLKRTVAAPAADVDRLAPGHLTRSRPALRRARSRRPPRRPAARPRARPASRR